METKTVRTLTLFKQDVDINIRSTYLLIKDIPIDIKVLPLNIANIKFGERYNASCREFYDVN